MTKTFADQTGFLRAFLDAVPALLFVVDEDVAILECNAAASRLLDVDKADALKRRAGDVLHCIHSTDSEDGCGRGPFCRNCIIRSSVVKAFLGQEIVRRRAKMELVTENGVREIYALISVSSFTHAGERFALLLIEDISQLVELQKIVPICASCKKIRDDKGYWHQIEEYIKTHSETEFSHSICPDCAEKLYPELYKDKES